MAIIVDGAILNSGEGSASFNGANLTRIEKDSTTVWLAPNNSKTCCCSCVIPIHALNKVQFGDDSVNDEIRLGMHRDYDPGIPMQYELCACVHANICYCYLPSGAPGMQYGNQCADWAGSLGIKTIPAGQDAYGCWDTEAHRLDMTFPQNVCASWDNSSTVCLKLINHTMGVESGWLQWLGYSTDTYFFV